MLGAGLLEQESQCYSPGGKLSKCLSCKEGRKERKKMKLPLRNERQEAFAYHRRCREMACVMSIISFSIESKEV